jgi:hypothetical protein
MEKGTTPATASRAKGLDWQVETTFSPMEELVIWAVHSFAP